jgi:hypothetical protein
MPHMSETDWFLLIPLGLAVAFMIWVFWMLGREASLHPHPHGRGFFAHRRGGQDLWE